jgi:membrane-anchored glycerophosphoryl diester phosphodiesterase (GDPDase)
MLHIFVRFVLHFVASTALVLIVFLALRYWGRQNCKVKNWISGIHQHLLVTSALIVFSLATLREPLDIYYGAEVWYKAIFDQVSWFLGAAVSAWGLFRFKNMND